MEESSLDILFYELIRVAIDAQGCLSRLPEVGEWGKLYKKAKKQSLVGVCFAALQKLGADMDDGFDRIGMNEMLYLKWMGMAAKIQQKNEIVNRQCRALQKRLSADGLRSVILKGQGVGQLYGSLMGLRQSGDIDVWVSGSRDETMAYVQKVSPTNEVTRLHTQLKVFEETEVEIHFMPTYMRCPWLNASLQKWFKKYEDFDSFRIKDGIRVPSLEFNVVFLLLHIFRHLLGEGIGLRQVMDYYFVLQEYEGMGGGCDKAETMKLLEHLRLHRFASGLMWVLAIVFDGQSQVKGNRLEVKEWMICEPDEKLGRLILREIELSGNFGLHDERSKEGESALKRFYRTNATNLRFMRYFPEEVLCTPFYRAWHKCWQLRHGYRG